MSTRLSIARWAGAVLTGAVCSIAGAANISPAVHDAARDQLKASYKAEREACDRLAGNAKDICIETAKGKEKVAMAHLQYQRSGDAKDLGKLAEARYEARYELAKEACDDQAGNAKDVCMATAKADRDKAKADAKANQQTRAARSDALDAKEQADYKVAAERCDTLSGKDKDVCIASARARYGQ
jgi:hypothetical protein